NDMQILALRNTLNAARCCAGGDPTLSVVVRGIHNQCVSFPPSNRIAIPLPNTMWKMRPAIDRDHTSFVNHFVQKNDVTGNLDNLVSIVVSRRKHSGRNAARDTAVPHTHVLPGIDDMHSIVVSSGFSGGF